ncbi:hypothetical protein AB0B12_32190 [Streptomyces sp. NPDC044780]|uniref:hypothetical protein n=1 Tax=unclassified Streptomyces TaxID=2593676 RepID=UPI003406372C
MHGLRNEDLARLSPLQHANPEVRGRRWGVRATVPAGGCLRPLCDPAWVGSTPIGAVADPIRVRVTTRVALRLTLSP